MSKIQWTDETWNPTTGCTKISPGCANCYIETTIPFRTAGRTFVKGHIPLILHGDRLDKPLHWKKPRRVFVNSLSDLFHCDVPESFIDSVFRTMAACPQHTFQVLTKRPERMQRYVSDRWNYTSGKVWLPLPNVWLGVSVEDRERRKRIDILRHTPAAVRFLSLEPLLEDLGDIGLAHPDEDGHCSRCGCAWDETPHICPPGFGGMIDWVIVGGESGHGARPCNIAWVRSIVEQCRAAGVACFVKQLGSNPISEKVGGFIAQSDSKGGNPNDWAPDLRVREFPTVKGGAMA